MTTMSRTLRCTAGFNNSSEEQEVTVSQLMKEGFYCDSQGSVERLEAKVEFLEEVLVRLLETVPITNLELKCITGNEFTYWQVVDLGE